MAKFHIKTGDTVVVIAGSHKGEQGKIVRMIPKQHRAIVEGVNLVTKHIKPSATSPRVGFRKLKRHFIFQTSCSLIVKALQPARESVLRPME
jgi:ribosomal protein L24